MECDSHCFAAYSLFFSENVKFKIRFEEPMPWHVDRAYHHSQTPLFLVPCANQIFSDIIFYFCSAVALAGLLLIAPIYFFLQKPWTRKRLEISPEIKSPKFFFSQERWTMSTGHGSEKLLLSAVPTPVSSFHLVKFLFPFVFDACLQN